MMKRKICLYLCLIACLMLQAQNLTLDECRQLAMRQNKQTEIDQENIEAAKDLHRASVAKLFPKVTLNGAYQWNEKNLFLLPNESGLGLGYNGWEQVIKGTGDRKIDQAMGQQLSTWYDRLHQATEIDIQHLWVGTATVTQPIFLGCGLANGIKLSQSNIQLMEFKAEKDKLDLIVKVDEAYWRVLTVESKFALATEYLNLLKQLEANVSSLVEIGLATEADLLKVRVKRQQAETSHLQAENGLKLSKMALCQLCGLDINYDIQLHDDGLEVPMLLTTESGDGDSRSEIKMLSEAKKAAHAGVMISASTLMPKIMAQASYLTTNPNLHNGLKNEFSGMFTAGVVVNIPIAHADNIYEVKAAKHKEHTIELQLEEAKEKIHLQITQSAHAVQLANAKLAQADAAVRSAEENLHYAEESFRAGLIGATDVMMAQTAWQQAKSEKIEAAGEARLAEVTFLKNTGKL